MAKSTSSWAESEMDETKLKALEAAEKIPPRHLIRWIEAAGQHWPSGQEGEIPIFQAYCECGFRLPAHPFLTAVLAYFGVELVNLVPNSITMLSVFVYLCEAYLGIPPNVDLFRYYYEMRSQSGIAGSCGLKLHDGKTEAYIQMYTRSSWPGWRKRWFYWETTREDSLSFEGKVSDLIVACIDETEQTKTPPPKRRRLVRASDKRKGDSSTNISLDVQPLAAAPAPEDAPAIPPPLIPNETIQKFTEDLAAASEIGAIILASPPLPVATQKVI